MRSTTAAKKRAAGAPSTAAWSNVSERWMWGFSTSCPSRIAGIARIAPTPSTATCGGLTIGVELLDAERAERGEREGRVEHVLGRQLLRLRALREPRDLAPVRPAGVEQVRVPHDRDDQAGLGVDGDAEVDIGEGGQFVVGDPAVEPAMLASARTAASATSAVTPGPPSSRRP